MLAFLKYQNPIRYRKILLSNVIDRAYCNLEQACINPHSLVFHPAMVLYIIYCILYYIIYDIYYLVEKLTGLQLVKKFPAFHGTRTFITALTSVRHLSLSWASSVQSIYPHPTSWRSILILSTYLRLGLPCDLLPSGFPTKTLYTPLLTHTRYMPSPSHSSRFYHPHNIG